MGVRKVEFERLFVVCALMVGHLFKHCDCEQKNDWKMRQVFPTLSKVLMSAKFLKLRQVLRINPARLANAICSHRANSQQVDLPLNRFIVRLLPEIVCGPISEAITAWPEKDLNQIRINLKCIYLRFLDIVLTHGRTEHPSERWTIKTSPFLRMRT